MSRRQEIVDHVRKVGEYLAENAETIVGEDETVQYVEIDISVGNGNICILGAPIVDAELETHVHKSDRIAAYSRKYTEGA